MMDSILSWFQNHNAITLQVFAVVFISLLANYLIQRTLKGLDKQLGKTKTPWDNILAEALSKPVAYLVAY